MLSMKSFLTSLLVLLLGLFCANARSNPSAFVTFYGLEFQLFDLNEADGIVPQISLDEVERFGSASQYSLPEASTPPLREDHIFDRGGLRLADTNGESWVVMLDAFMEAGAASTGGGAYAAALNDSFTFTLTPHTRAVFSSLTESVVTAASYGSAIAVVGLVGDQTGVPGQSVNFEAFNLMTESGRSSLPIAVETASGNVAASGEIALRGNVFASSAMPIPEPGQYWMVLAGLVLFAVARFRHPPTRRDPMLDTRFRLPGPWPLPEVMSRPSLIRFAAAYGLGLAAITSPGSAHASSGSASVRDFSYQLIDLDPADGITPSLIFRSDIINGNAFANMNNLLGNPWDDELALTTYGTGAIEKGPGGASTEVSPGTAQADALAWRGAFSAGSVSGHEFTLTPNTHVVFSATAQIRVSHDFINHPPERSQAFAGLFGEIATISGQRTQFDSHLFSESTGSNTMPVAVHAFTGQFAGTGNVRAQASAFAIGVSPIPEPAAWAMLVAGLAFACVPIRRSRPI